MKANKVFNMEKHTIYIFFLAFLIITLQSFGTSYFIFCVAVTFVLLTCYWIRFKLVELLPGVILSIFLLVLFKLITPIENPQKVVWITENWNDEKIALLSNGSKVPIEEAKIGDIVDETGRVIKRGNTLIYFFPNVRYKLYKKLKESISFPISEVAGGITLGIRREIPDSVKSYFLLSGLYPFLAISGLHISIVIGAIALILKFLRIKKPLTKASLIALFFMPFTGLPTSAIRAYLFTLFISLGIENYRKFSPFYLLGIILFISAIGKSLSTGAVLSFLAVTGIIVALEFTESKIIKSLLVAIAPVLFTAPVVLSKFGTFNLLSFVNSQIAGIIFVPFLITTFLSEITFFKINFINNLVEITGSFFLQFSKELFLLTKNFIFYSKLSLWISGIALGIMFLFLLSKKSKLSFIPPVTLLFYAFFLPTEINNKTFLLKGYKMNSFQFISKEGQSFRNCLIYSDYVFPYAKKCLYKNKIFDKRVIIATKPKEVRK
nr:ComEC/Rec2 family competence protein [Desulfurobacterium thermolithotrophum]